MRSLHKILLNTQSPLFNSRYNGNTDLSYEQDFESSLKQEGFEIKLNIAPDALSKFALNDHPFAHMDSPMFFNDSLQFDRHSSLQMNSQNNMGIEPMMKNNIMADGRLSGDDMRNSKMARDYSTSSSDGNDYDVTNNNNDLYLRKIEPTPHYDPIQRVRDEVMKKQF